MPYDTDLGGDPAASVAEAAAFGAKVGCYVVNEPVRMQELAAAGVWGFVTDVPDVARAALPSDPPADEG
jgi:glycerophosphoryl diester phosphodiesterase